MSASPMARQASGLQSIPTRRVVINHENELPTDYGTTPGGTLFGTTPGGTRIVYERNYLLNLRNSPLARSPPPNLPNIPGVTSPASPSASAGSPTKDSKQAVKRGDCKEPNGKGPSPARSAPAPDSIKEEDEQFSMDM